MMALLRPVVVLLLSLTLVSPGGFSSTDSRWLDQGQLTVQANELMRILATAQDYGLRSQDYRLDLKAQELQSLRTGRATPSLRERVDVALSRAAMRFLVDVRYGRVDPRTVNFNLPVPAPRPSSEWMLENLAHSSNIAAAIATWEPTPPPYQKLKQALRKYRELASHPGLNTLPTFKARSLRPGEEYAGAPQLRALLIALGDLTPSAEEQAQPIRIDAELVAGLTHFQQRHGLSPDGVLGKGTFAALTAPLQQRVQQLELTLERWRWIAALERPDIVVNVPQFKLYALPRGDHARGSVIEMAVIVGQSYPHLRTPIFAADLRQVVFHPFWDVPRSILRRELLPHLRRDPSYLDRHHMEIVQGASDNARVLQATPEVLEGLASGRYRLRQRPGADNALGAIKFVMPNPYSVYLHSTPQIELFQRARRAFSHGCIRVSEPTVLAEYVLHSAPGDWSSPSIEATLATNQTARVTLTEPLHVTVFYSTAAVNGSDTVAFYEDLYGHDRTLQTMLDRMRP